MQKTFTTGYVITGDAAKGVKAIRRVREEAESLDSTNKKAKDSSKKWREETERQGTTLDKTAESISRTKTLIVGMTAALGAIGAISFGQTMVAEFREWETGLVGVAKTTGLAGEELDSFAARIDAASRHIPVSTQELLELAQAAGQMGVTGADNLEKFSTTIAKLGRASDLAGEEAASSLARILNVTGESIDSVDVLASVIVSLGNSVAASESEIARMTTEVARATSQFGVSSAEAAGLAAAMASIGIRAELGGSSVGRAMQEITSRVQAGGAELQEFADILGLNADELKRLFEQDRVAAFEYFLRNVGELGLDAGNALKDVGLGGQEIAKTIIPLSNNMGIFATTMGLAAAEVENATALEREFAATLDTLDSQWEISQNILKSYRLELANNLMPSVTEALKSFNEWSATDGPREMLESLTTAAEALTVLFGGRLVGAIGAAAAAKTAAMAASLAYEASVVRLAFESGAAAGAQYSLARAAGAARGAMALLGGPAGILGIVATGLYVFREELGLVPADVSDAQAAIDRLTGSLENLTAAQLGLRKISAQEQLEEAERAAAHYQARIDSIQKMIARSGIAAHQDLRDSLVEMQAGYDTAAQAAEGYRDAIAAIEAAVVGLVHSPDIFVGPLTQIQAVTAALDEMFKSEASFASAAAAVSEFTDAEALAIQYYKDLVNESSALRKEVDAHEKAMRSANQRIEDHIAGLRQQKEASTMTARAAAIYNAVMNLGTTATSAQIVAVATLTAELFDQELALKAAADANTEYEKRQADLARASERAAKQMADDWRETRQAFGEFFADMVEDGESAFDSLLKSFRRMLLEMTGQLALSGIMKMAGITVPGGSHGGMSGILDSSGMSGTVMRAIGNTPAFEKLSKSNGLSGITGSMPGKELAGPVQPGQGALTQGFDGTAFMQGAKTMGLNMVAGWAGSMAGGALGEAIFDKQAESNIGATIGSTIGSMWGPWFAALGGAIGGMVDVATGGDGYTRQNAGMLVAPTPGAKSEHTFEVDPFASGLQVTGFARREDQETALRNIEMFRGFDSVLTSLARDLGGFLSVTSLHGLNEEATPGSSGTYLGSGRDADLQGQLDWFVTQLADNISGIDEALLETVRNATTADEVIKLLAEAVEKQQALTVYLPAVNEELERLGLGLFDVTEEGAALAEQLLATAGGIEGLAIGSSTYFKNFYTAGEKFNLLTSDVADGFDQLGIKMPRTEAALRELVSGLDLTTDAGRLTFTSIMSASDALGEYYDILEDQAQNVGSGFADLRERIFMDSLGSAESQYGYLKSQFDSLSSLLPSLTDADAIASVKNELLDLMSSSYNLLDEGTRKDKSAEFIKQLDDIERASLEQLQRVQQQGDVNADAWEKTMNAATGKFTKDLEKVLQDNNQSTTKTQQVLDSIVRQFGIFVSSLPSNIQIKIASTEIG